VCAQAQGEGEGRDEDGDRAGEGADRFGGNGRLAPPGVVDGAGVPGQFLDVLGDGKGEGGIEQPDEATSVECFEQPFDRGRVGVPVREDQDPGAHGREVGGGTAGVIR
jgi:hypothetical protein